MSPFGVGDGRLRPGLPAHGLRRGRRRVSRSASIVNSWRTQSSSSCAASGRSGLEASICSRSVAVPSSASSSQICAGVVVERRRPPVERPLEPGHLDAQDRRRVLRELGSRRSSRSRRSRPPRGSVGRSYGSHVCQERKAGLATASVVEAMRQARPAGRRPQRPGRAPWAVLAPEQEEDREHADQRERAGPEAGGRPGTSVAGQATATTRPRAAPDRPARHHEHARRRR